MSVTTEEQLEEGSVEAGHARLLFPEARARRRRIRVVVAVGLLVIAVGVAVAIDRSGVVRKGPQNATSAAGTAVTPSRAPIHSLVFTETWHVLDPGPPLTFYNSPLVKMVVATTIGVTAPSSFSRDYDTSWTRHPKITTTLGAIVQRGVIFSPNTSGRTRVCTESNDEKSCSVVTSPWIEERYSQLPRLAPGSAAATSNSPASLSPAARIALSQSRYDPTELFADIRKSVGSLQRVGAERIGGVVTTIYRGSLPAQTSKQLLAAPPAELAVLRLAISGNGSYFYGGEHGGQLQTSFVVNFTEVPIKIWVDGDGVVRQVQVRVPELGFKLVGLTHDSEIVPTVVTINYSSFNTPIAPPQVPRRNVFVLQGRIVADR